MALPPYRSEFPARIVERVSRMMVDLRDLYGADGCWIWPLSHRHGYGQIAFSERGNHVVVPSHRVSWVAAGRHLPDDMTIDHMCRTTLCINPGHLRLLTLAENTLAALTVNVGTHCRRGHEFDEANTILIQRPSGTCRLCRTCRDARGRRRRRSDDALPAVSTSEDGGFVCRLGFLDDDEEGER